MTPTSHDFGNVQVGADGAPQVFTLINNFNPSSLTVGTPTITGGNVGDFAVIQDGCTNRTIPIEGTCTFTVRFRPTATGPRSSTVSLETTSNTHTATLSGTGTVAASLTVTPDTLTFGPQAAGTTSTLQEVTVENVGSTAIQLGAVSIGDAAFSTVDDECSNATLQPDEECTIAVTFTPAALGPASGTLTIPSDAPEGSHEVALSGEGTEPPVGTIAITPGSHTFSGRAVGTTSGAQSFTIAHTGGGPVALGALTIAGDELTRGMSVTPGSVDFGAQASGVPSAARTIVIANTADTALLIGLMSLGGPNAGDFLLVGESCGGAALLPGQQCSFGIVFLPAGADPSAAMVTIPHNADGGSYIVGLAGNGGVAADGGVVATVAVPEFALVDNTCAGAILEAGADCTFGVTFAPALGGERAATLALASDAGNGPHSVTLGGTGQVDETPLLLFTPLLLDFGDQPTGGSAAPQAVTVTNTDGAELNISGVSLDGDAASSFVIVLGDDQCSGASLATGQSCSVLVGFDPAATGRSNAILVFAVDAPGGQRVIALTGNGVVPPAPSVGPSATSHAFGDQYVGTTGAAQSFTLTNTGTAALHLGTLAFEGAGSPFVLSDDTCSGAELAPLDTCTFAVAFAPTALGLQNDTLTIPSDAASSPDMIALSGTGIAPPAPVLWLSTGSVSFEDQVVDTASAPQTITVRNDGDAALSITTVMIGGAGSDQFDFGTDTCTGAALDPDDTCTFEVSFAPTTLGPANATVSIASNAASSPDTVSLGGTGVAPPAPAAALSTDRLDFGNHQVDTTSAAQPVRLTNSGTAPLTIVAITASGDFAQTNDCPSSLAANASCTINVTFVPTASGNREGTLTVASDAASSPDTAALAGMGTAPAFSVAPSALDFESQPFGTTSAQKSVTVTNTGFGPVAPGAGVFSGPGFAVVTDECAAAALAPLQTCTITLTFAPTALGPASGTLVIGAQSVALTGNGISAPVATTLGVAKASGTYGGTVTLSATLRNSDNSAPLASKLISFIIGGTTVGTATTDASGTAILPDVPLGTREAGSYANAVGASFAGNLTALPGSGTANLTVARAILTVTADDQSRAFGSANPALTVRYSGFVNGDTPAALTGRPAVTSAATIMSDAGSYPITPARSTLNAANYTFAFVNGALTVTPVPLTIAAVSASRTYGAANPALTVRYSGFRLGDNAADLRGTPSVVTMATPSSAPGVYPIVVGRGTIKSNNYALSFVDGTLIVTQMATALSAVSGTATYGGTATLTATLRQAGWGGATITGAPITFSLDGLPVGTALTNANGVATLANVALDGRGAGNYAGLVGASFADNLNQRGDTAAGTLRVARAALVLRAVDQTRRVGEDNPPCAIELAPGASFVNGDTLASLDLQNLACYCSGANRLSRAGTYVILVFGVRSDNYTITYRSGTLTVRP